MPQVPFFLKDKPQTGVITEHRSEKEKEENYGLMAAAEELWRAVEAKDTKATARALQSAFELLDSMPHEEGPHEEME